MLNGFGSCCSSCIISSDGVQGVSMAASILSVPAIHLYSIFFLCSVQLHDKTQRENETIERKAISEGLGM